MARHEAAQQPEPGSDLEYQVNVGFWQAIRGTVMKLSIPHLEQCAHCHGSGYIESPGVCPRVPRQGPGHAEERQHEVQRAVSAMRRQRQEPHRLSTCATAKAAVERSETLEVRIKPGTRDGQRIRLAGRGNAGTMGAPAGDLYIIVRAGEHPLFQRDGDDIHLTVPVSVTEAALGAKVEVPTIDGRALLQIPPGTQSGQKLRLREKGVPSAGEEKASAATKLSRSRWSRPTSPTRSRRKFCASWPS